MKDVRMGLKMGQEERVDYRSSCPGSVQVIGPP